MKILKEKSSHEVEMPNDKYRFGTLDEEDERRMFEGAATVAYMTVAVLGLILIISIIGMIKLF